MTTPTDKELRALAEAAIKANGENGLWEHVEKRTGIQEVGDTWGPVCTFGYLREEDHEWLPYDDAESYAAFIAATNPQTVLGLLDRIAGAEQRGPLWCQLPEGSVDGDPCPAGCPADGVCRAVYLRKSEAVAECEEIASLKAELSATRSQLEGLTEALGIIAMASGMPLPNPEGVLKSINKDAKMALRRAAAQGET